MRALGNLSIIEKFRIFFFNLKAIRTKPIIGEMMNTNSAIFNKNFTILDPNIPFFIFLDTATASFTPESFDFRNEFDYYLSRNISENGEEIPIVTLVLGGTVSTLNTISRSIVKYQIPSIFVESCRKCSEVFSYFVKNESKTQITDELIWNKINEFMSTNTESDKRQMQEQILDILMPDKMVFIYFFFFLVRL
jgi:hypothetical protein